jgi:hypothetical protein
MKFLLHTELSIVTILITPTWLHLHVKTLRRNHLTVENSNLGARAVKIQGFFSLMKNDAAGFSWQCSPNSCIPFFYPGTYCRSGGKKAKATADQAPKIRVSSGHLWREWQVHRRALHTHLGSNIFSGLISHRTYGVYEIYNR